MASTSTVQEGSRVSTKPWSLTYNATDKEVFIWKAGARLQVQSSGSTQSSGCLREISVADEQNGSLLLKGDTKSECQYKFRCFLKNFDDKCNDFCKKLGSFANANDFCLALEDITDGIVKTSILSLERKRCGSIEIEKESVKRLKLSIDANDISREIGSELIGLYQIPLSLLSDPPEYLKVREKKTWYIKYLKEVIESDDQENLTSPLLVLASVGRQFFKESDLTKYSYQPQNRGCFAQVIGGVQRFCAIREISGITNRKCTVYGNKLSRRCILYLAKQHNDANQIQRETTFAEVSASCRRLLFCHFANEKEDDDGQTMPLVPRYNSEKYKAFKLECMTYLQSPQISKPYIETAIQMALQHPKVYHMMQDVFQMFEDGELKKQKIRSRDSEIGRKKALQGHFSAKLHHFKLFQGLSDEDKLRILNALRSKDMSFEDASSIIQELKGWNTTENVFLKELNLQSWEEAETRFPAFAKKERLLKFKCNSKTIPKKLKDYCELARSQQQSTEHVQVTNFGNSKVSVIVVGSTSNFNLSLEEEWTLVVIDTMKVSSVEDLKTILLEVVAHNHATSWSVAIHHFPHLEHEPLEKIGLEVGFKMLRRFQICSLSSIVSSTSPMKLLESEVIILGWYGSESLPQNHPLQGRNNMMVVQTGKEWLFNVICGGTILELFSQCGEAAQVAIKKDVSCTCVQLSEEDAASTMHALASLKEMNPDAITAHVGDTEELINDIEVEEMRANQILAGASARNTNSNDDPADMEATNEGAAGLEMENSEDDEHVSTGDAEKLMNKGIKSGRLKVRKRGSFRKVYSTRGRPSADD